MQFPIKQFFTKFQTPSWCLMSANAYEFSKPEWVGVTYSACNILASKEDFSAEHGTLPWQTFQSNITRTNEQPFYSLTKKTWFTTVKVDKNGKKIRPTK